MVLPTKDLKGRIHISKNTATFDHIIPRSKGAGRYRKDNMVLCCYSCNQEKESKSLIKMLKYKLFGRKHRKFVAAQVKAADQRAFQEQLREFLKPKAKWE
jgi:5-methylcytosine-specific restriction endonuclease McrA